MEQDETTKRDSKGIFMTISSNYPGWFRWMHAEQGRCFYWMKVSYYPNATSTCQFMMILKSGNVALNPGPTAKALVEKKSCLVCSRTGARNHRAVECCFICKRWCHIKCGSISPRRYNELAKNNSILTWSCPECLYTRNLCTGQLNVIYYSFKRICWTASVFT